MTSQVERILCPFCATEITPKQTKCKCGAKFSICFHENRQQYDQFENEETGEIEYYDYEVCKDCGKIII